MMPEAPGMEHPGARRLGGMKSEHHPGQGIFLNQAF
jgi:hypothetical protein